MVYCLRVSNRTGGGENIRDIVNLNKKNFGQTAIVQRPSIWRPRPLSLIAQTVTKAAAIDYRDISEGKCENWRKNGTD